MILLRSYLYAPGDNPRLLDKVYGAGADAVVLDLEDAVAPARKAEARALVAARLAALAPEGPPTYVRINAVATTWWRDDLVAVVRQGIAGLRIGKVESAQQVMAVATELNRLEHERGLTPGAIGLIPMIESAVGVLHAPAIAAAARVEALAFGAADFLADIAGDADSHETSTAYARSAVVIAARSANIHAPIASVFTDLQDLDGLARTTGAARRLGFFGRSAIHPAQVAVINDAFTPTAVELANARALAAAFDQAEAAGQAVAQLGDGRFVDRPIVDRARALLALADRLEAQHA